MTKEDILVHMNDFFSYLEIEKNFSLHTLRAYKTDLTQLVHFWEAFCIKEPIKKYDATKIIKRYISSLFYRKITKTSLARKLSSLRSFQEFLRGQGITSINFSIKTPRLDKKLPEVLSVDEIFYLLDSINDKDLPTPYPNRDKAIFELLYATGVRCSEVVNIKLTDIDFVNKSIRILGKGKKERIVLYGSKAEVMMQKYMTTERMILVAEHVGEQPYLFLNYTGGLLTSRSVQRIFEMFRKFLHIDRSLTPHKVRHSFASHLLEQGADLRVIQELLGHKTITSTEIYTAVSSQQLAKMVDEKHPLNTMNHALKPKKS